jgi:hypothetical protein
MHILENYMKQVSNVIKNVFQMCFNPNTSCFKFALEMKHFFFSKTFKNILNNTNSFGMEYFDSTTSIILMMSK